MDLRVRLEETEGLTSLSAWHNGDHWVCAAQLHHGLTEVGHGDSVGAAVLASLAELEDHRGKTPAERWPDLAPRFEALRKSATKEPEVLDFDGY